ncbi:MAG TPA: acyl-CoA dehydrogenase family protein [Baekduia sp.]|nr:acyl-CoA dehydrogenase family protein [Baekduia sp.]
MFDDTHKSPNSMTSVVDEARGLVGLLRERGSEIDELGVLPREVVQAMDDAGMYRIGIPESAGGLGPVSISDRTETFLELGRGNASAAWSVWADLPTTEFIHQFGAEMADELYGTEHVGPLTGGSAFNLAQSVGVGQQVDGGYRLKGSWRFCSNSRLAAWVFLGFDWTDEKGDTKRSVALVPRADFSVADNWNVTAMRGTGSNSVFIKDYVYVPGHRVKSLETAGTEAENNRLGLTIMLDVAAMLVGMALGAKETFVEAASKRAPWGQPYPTMSHMPFVQTALGRASSRINVARLALMSHARNADELGDGLGSEAVTTAGYDSIQIAHDMREVAEELRNVMGTSTFAAGDALGRFARDATGMCLHGAMREWSQESHGRAILGVEEPGEFSMTTSLTPPQIGEFDELIESDPRTMWSPAMTSTSSQVRAGVDGGRA